MYILPNDSQGVKEHLSFSKKPLHIRGKSYVGKTYVPVFKNRGGCKAVVIKKYHIF